MMFETSVLEPLVDLVPVRLRRALGKYLDQGMRLPLVSVIVTAYNSEQFIGQTLDSVLAQTYPQIECIIVEDCATDGTLEVIQTWLEAHPDPRFSLLRREVNGGQLAAQITGFRASQGEFVVNLDADDVLLPEAFETHLLCHLAASPVVAMTCLDSAMIDQDGVLLSGHHREVRPLVWSWFRPRPVQQRVRTGGEEMHCELIPSSAANVVILEDEYYWTTQSFMMFRRKALEIVLPEETTMFRVCADYYLVRMIHAFNATYFIHHTGGFYRLHASNHFTHQALLSSDQQSGDYTRFGWQAKDLGRLAAGILQERFAQFSIMYGEFHLARALFSLPWKSRPAVFRPLRQRLGFLPAFRFWMIGKVNRVVVGVRCRCVRARRILWAGY